MSKCCQFLDSTYFLQSTMLYTASYFMPERHHGKKVSISCSVPKGFKVDNKLSFLAPNAELLTDWKNSKIDEAEYTERYRAQIKHDWKQVKAWLDSLNSQEDLTLLCWERTGFCHRNLVAKLIKHYRPDCFGGSDIVRVDMEICRNCNSELCPGLDLSQCFICKTSVVHFRLCNAG